MCDLTTEDLIPDGVCTIDDCPVSPMIEPRPEPPDPFYPYGIKSFGAHYFKFQTNDRELTIHMEKDASLPNAAYAVFFTTQHISNPYIDWTPMSAFEDIIIYPQYPVWDRVVLMITAFEGIWDYADLTTPTPYGDTYGYYRLISEDIFPLLSPERELLISILEKTSLI